MFLLIYYIGFLGCIMSKWRINTILKLAAPTCSKNENTMPISRKNENAVLTSSNIENTSVNLPILTYEDIIMNADVVFGDPRNNICNDFPDF